MPLQVEGGALRLIRYAENCFLMARAGAAPYEVDSSLGGWR